GSLWFTAFLVLLLGVGRSSFLLVFHVLVPRVYRPLPKIFLDIIQSGVFLAALVFTLAIAGVDPLSLLTGSAVLPAIIGLSIKDTLGNLFAGLALEMQTPFEIGDWVQFGDTAGPVGRVVEINWRATKVLTTEQVEITIPNAVLGQGTLR